MEMIDHKTEQRQIHECSWEIQNSKFKRLAPCPTKGKFNPAKALEGRVMFRHSKRKRYTRSDK